MASGNDMKAANATYAGFIGLLKWSVPAIAIVALIIVILISS
ncbi:aa3-type cytochrome c oxidase subunit IV [Pelagerythrobacter aerophilus]|uniref:Aa3-type cytochrome c oxidase subunit IV n=1 Tax=Pelagerythrobacter aerophilus TaxID=2306995 RepID=A0A418NI91_9SPHN|nr:aa3-type cytochrome c oxidase subunit IV [Pelagerythrobacter aerophilus]RIV78643.1 aa3-type cytochrome c oxidase subunit IV [Pelagerythrobacter aerophilus]